MPGERIEIGPGFRIQNSKLTTSNLHQALAVGTETDTLQEWHSLWGNFGGILARLEIDDSTLCLTVLRSRHDRQPLAVGSERDPRPLAGAVEAIDLCFWKLPDQFIAWYIP